MEKGEINLPRSLTYLLVFVAVCFWATSGIAGNLLMNLGLEPLTVAWFRAFICFFLPFVYLFIRSKQLLQVARRDLIFFMLYGLVGIAMLYFCFFSCINLAGVTIATTLLYTSPIFVTVFSIFVFKEKINFIKLCCLLAAIGGCFLVVRGYELSLLKVNLPGILMGFGSGFFYALYTVLGKIVVKRYHPLTVVLYSTGFGSLFITFFNPSFPILPLTSPLTWIYLIYLGLVPSLLAYFLYIKALENCEAIHASVITVLEPAIAGIFSYFLFQERLEALQLFGMFLMLLAVALLINRQQKAEGLNRKGETAQC